MIDHLKDVLGSGARQGVVQRRRGVLDDQRQPEDDCGRDSPGVARASRRHDKQHQCDNGQHRTEAVHPSNLEGDDGAPAVAPRQEAVTVDGLPPGEGAFLLTTFWLADNLALLGRTDEAQAIFERLLGLANDVGLLSEEYDVAGSRMLGNFPQAFSHVGLILCASNLSHGARGPAFHRGVTVGGTPPPSPSPSAGAVGT